MTDPTAATILKQIESLGYVVKIFRVNDVVEMYAVPSRGSDQPTSPVQ